MFPKKMKYLGLCQMSTDFFLDEAGWLPVIL